MLHSRALVAKYQKKPVYLFPTQSTEDGYGVVLLNGSTESLPDSVRLAYEKAAERGSQG